MAPQRRSSWRASLRPAANLTPIEGVMWRWDADDFATIELSGGPPGLMVSVLLDGQRSGGIRLNGYGSGSIAVASRARDTTVEVIAEQLVLLRGHLAPSTTTAEGSS